MLRLVCHRNKPCKYSVLVPTCLPPKIGKANWAILELRYHPTTEPILINADLIILATKSNLLNASPVPHVKLIQLLFSISDCVWASGGFCLPENAWMFNVQWMLSVGCELNYCRHSMREQFYEDVTLHMQQTVATIRLLSIISTQLRAAIAAAHNTRIH